MKTKTTNPIPNKPTEQSLLLFETNELVSSLIKTQASDFRRAATKLDEAADALSGEDYSRAAGSYRAHLELLANYRRLGGEMAALLQELDFALSGQSPTQS